MKTSTEQLNRWRAQHHKALESLASEVMCKTPGKTLWSKLARLERELYAVCLDYTNGTNGVTTEIWQESKKRGWVELRKIFGDRLPAGLVINGDPRGSMLKLDCDVRPIPEGMEHDWGGDGMLAATIEREES